MEKPSYEKELDDIRRYVVIGDSRTARDLFRDFWRKWYPHVHMPPLSSEVFSDGDRFGSIANDLLDSLDLDNMLWQHGEPLRQVPRELTQSVAAMHLHAEAVERQRSRSPDDPRRRLFM